MSDKNEVSENIKTEGTNSLLEKIRSKYVIKHIFTFLKYYKWPRLLLGPSKTTEIYLELINDLDLKLKNILDELTDFRNCFYYLKYINRALEAVGTEFYYRQYSSIYTFDDDPEEYTYGYFWDNRDNKEDEWRKQYMAAIRCILLIEIVRLGKCNALFKEENLKIQKYKCKSEEDKKQITSYETIYSIIQEALYKSLSTLQSKVLYASVCLYDDLAYKHKDNKDGYIYLEIKGYCYGYMYWKIKEYYKEIFSLYKNDQDFKYDLCFLFLKTIWLKDNRNNDSDKNVFQNVNQRVLECLELPNFKDSSFDYKRLIKHLQENKNWDFCSFVCGDGDFDIRTYYNVGFVEAIENALLTQKQKDKFKNENKINEMNKLEKFNLAIKTIHNMNPQEKYKQIENMNLKLNDQVQITNRNESKNNELEKDIKKEEPKPNCEKEDSKDI